MLFSRFIIVFRPYGLPWEDGAPALKEVEDAKTKRVILCIVAGFVQPHPWQGIPTGINSLQSAPARTPLLQSLPIAR